MEAKTKEQAIEAIVKASMAKPDSKPKRKFLCNGYYCPIQKANIKVTIVIFEGTPSWHDAYKNWLAGKPPTDSPEWKKGVVLGYFSYPVTGFSYLKK